ncbi:Hypothetical protein, putative, partial [Bodo saltans]
MSSFVGTSSGSPHSLRTRWTPLDVRLTGRIVEEHQQLIATLQSGISNAGTFTTLASNAKMRGLVDTIAARRSAILEFIVHHRTLQGEADAQQIQAFEALLERLSSAEQRAWDWDGSRHLMITPGGSVITHRRPLVSAAANASYHAAQSPKRGVTPRKGTTLVQHVDHLLPQHHIVQPGAHAAPASTAFTPKRRSRSAPHDSTASIAARRSAILEFIVHHRTLQGEADAQQIQAFEALLERLSSAEQRAWDWDGSRHLMITPGGSVITHRRPLVSAAANASYHAAQSPKRGVTPRKGTTLVQHVDHLLPQHHIVQPGAHAAPASTAFTPKRRSRSAPHDSTASQPSA